MSLRVKLRPSRPIGPRPLYPRFRKATALPGPNSGHWPSNPAAKVAAFSKTLAHPARRASAGAVAICSEFRVRRIISVSAIARTAAQYCSISAFASARPKASRHRSRFARVDGRRRRNSRTRGALDECGGNPGQGSARTRSQGLDPIEPRRSGAASGWRCHRAEKSPSLIPPNHQSMSREILLPVAH
jgi:hypothetical protein